MSIMSGLFNVLALLYIFRGIQLAITIARDWASVVAEPLTRAKQSLAEQAAFFISVPFSVLVHESFHALAIWAFGGRVVEFGYRVFWGYVVPEGQFTPAQEWVISIAGTIGSLLFGLVVWLALRRNRSRSLQYFGLRTFRFQIYFSLLYYPLFSLFLPIGDWRTIYDFRLTPILSGATIIVHIGLLAWFYLADRKGRFEMVAFDTPAEQQRFESALHASAAGDDQARFQVVEMMRQGGAPHQARTSLQEYLAQNPDSPTGYLLLAFAQTDGKGHVSPEAVKNVERALQLQPSPREAALGYRLLALSALEHGDGVKAEQQVDLALAGAPEEGAPDDWPLSLRAELFNLRSQAMRRQGRLPEATADAQRAVAYARAAGASSAVARYQDELDLIAKHAAQTGKTSVAERV